MIVRLQMVRLTILTTYSNRCASHHLLKGAMELKTGIEPIPSSYQEEVLPLNYMSGQSPQYLTDEIASPARGPSEMGGAREWTRTTDILLVRQVL